MKRIDWLDVTKGIGVIIIIFGHISFYATRTLLQLLVYGFSVFIFFILSGLNFSKKINQPLIVLIKSILKNYIIPYVICVVMIVIVKAFVLGTMEAQSILEGLVLQIRYGSLWYVPVLLFSQVVLWIIFQLIKKKELRFVIILFLYLLSIILHQQLEMTWLWNIDLIPNGVFYLYTGLLLKDFMISTNYKWYINISIAAVLMIMSCVSTYFNNLTNPSSDFISFTCANILPLSILSAVAGTISVILVSKVIHKCRFFQYVGRNSFSFIAFNTSVVAYFLDETELSTIFWGGNKILKTILYIAIMVVCLSLLDVIYRFIKKYILIACKKLSLYNTKTNTN